MGNLSGTFFFCVLLLSNTTLAVAGEPRAHLLGHGPSHYSPADFFEGKIGYRIQTGQAGLYRKCNDDAQKTIFALHCLAATQ